MKILVVAPHADDEVLGVGATMARHADQGDDVVVAVMTGHGENGPHPVFPKEAWDVVRSEARQAHALLGVKETLFEEIPAAMVSDQATWQVNKITAEMVGRVEPDVLYVPFLLSFFVRVAMGWSSPGWLGPMGGHTGTYMVFYAIAVTKMMDTGALVVGKALGKHKLFPRLSPRKTWEGLAGGLAAAVLTSFGILWFTKGHIGFVKVGFIHGAILPVLLTVSGLWLTTTDP